MSLIIGLTGPTGSGKTTVSKAAESLGFKIIDCDKIARKAVEKGEEGLKSIVAAFGEEILLKDGELDRKTLALAAFSSKEKTELLNKTLLPYIVEKVKAEIEGEYILLDAPTLFESGLNSICQATIAVLCDENIRKVRIINRDGLSEREADLRMNAGKKDEFYLEKTENIIYNRGTEQELYDAAMKTFKKLLGGN